jgi:exosortase E/protease (VPEID-CTERM system)
MISVFLIGYLWLFRRQMRFPQAILLVPIGVALIWLSNALRIVVLIAIGAAGWPEIAMGGFHSQAGWLAFNAVALGLVAVTGRMRLFSRDASLQEASAGPDPTAAHLAPFLAMVATSMVTSAISADFNWFSPLRVLAAAVALWWFRNAYRKPDAMNSDARPQHEGMKAAAASAWSVVWCPMALGAIGFGIWLALVPIVPSANDGPWPKLAILPQGWAIAWMTVKTFGYVMVAPVAEELAFRDYLTRRLQAADFTKAPPGRFTWWSFVISSAAFGALHGPCWLPGTLAGMLFALALYRRGRLADAIVAHATTNALLAGYVFTTGNWSLWS